jgi:hypothetical protein
MNDNIHMYGCKSILSEKEFLAFITLIPFNILQNLRMFIMNLFLEKHVLN